MTFGTSSRWRVLYVTVEKSKGRKRNLYLSLRLSEGEPVLRFWLSLVLGHLCLSLRIE